MNLSTIENSFTLTQASLASGLPRSLVHKVVEGGFLSPHAKGVARGVPRLVTFDQVVYLRLEAEGVRWLSPSLRYEIARAFESSPDVDVLSVPRAPALLIQVKEARRVVEREVKKLRKLERLIVSDPEILNGRALFRGTQIPVDSVVNLIEQRMSVEGILALHPELRAEHVECAPQYMTAFPRRGRPPL